MSPDDGSDVMAAVKADGRLYARLVSQTNVPGDWTLHGLPTWDTGQ